MFCIVFCNLHTLHFPLTFWPLCPVSSMLPSKLKTSIFILTFRSHVQNSLCIGDILILCQPQALIYCSLPIHCHCQPLLTIPIQTSTSKNCLLLTVFIFLSLKALFLLPFSNNSILFTPFCQVPCTLIS
jgi:hypothetical protein